MELKRVLLATLLSFVVLLAYQSLFLKPVRKAPQGQAATSQGGSASSEQPPANPDKSKLSSTGILLQTSDGVAPSADPSLSNSGHQSTARW